MALRCGIVGLPNVGKSTLYRALTRTRVPAENYLFCTIEPNAGVVPVPDSRLAEVNAIVAAERVVPATVEFVDIAGLVRGASRGEGLGNRFLAHIREAHAVVQVVRCFEDENVAHVEGGVGPLRDIETIATELAIADLDTVERRRERAARGAKSGDRDARSEAACFEELAKQLSDGRPASSFHVPDAQRDAFDQSFLLTAKPVLYVANVDESSAAAGNAWSEAVEEHARGVGAGALRLCAAIEADLQELEPEERQAFLADLGIEEPGLDRLVREAYRLLDLVTFITTTGHKEVHAWTVRRDTRAEEAAAAVHTDFARNFVRAEVIHFDDFVAAGGEAGARARGLVHVEGRDYAVRDGDVIHFRAGAS